MCLRHNKLVRDNIPKIIRDSGKQCEVEVMAQEEYRQALLAKLVEEAKEAQEAAKEQGATSEQLLLELADLQEVMEAVIAAYGIDDAAVQVQLYKTRKNADAKSAAASQSDSN
jgi:predicted house-cleaning noncanonical NTP pyrophosphatase (MazG superfamily)